MTRRRLQCFTVKVRGEYYRKGGRIHTVHAVSEKHAIRLLRQARNFTFYPSMYVQENPKCDPQSGKPCLYRLVIQPSYGITPEREIAPNSPEWPGGERDRLLPLRPEREALFEKIKRQRKDAYGPD